MTRLMQIAMLLVLAMSVLLIPATKAQSKPEASNQDKFNACKNMADRKGLQGGDRKNFMQNCLNKATGTQPVGEMSEKDKINACKNLADKKNLNGADRRSFIKDCMNKANSR